MIDQQQLNKDIVTRFNKEFVIGGSKTVFEELISPEVVNHAAPAGTTDGKGSMWHFLNNMLRPAFPDLTVEIFDQIAEGDKVVTRKAFHGTHNGSFMGIAPTGKPVTIHVTDIIRIKDGQYAEHWGMSNIESVVAMLAEQG